MSAKSKAVLDSIRRVLSERSFSDSQIEKVLPHLHENHRRHPETLTEIIDCWNNLFCRSSLNGSFINEYASIKIPAIASPPVNSAVGKQKVNMAIILAEVEPKLLHLSPEKLIQRHRNIQGLGLMNSTTDHWITLFNAPRGFYLQDWFELTRKIMYIDQKVISLLYDQKEKREMVVHPIVSSAAVSEAEFDHIRLRYLFAERTGYTTLSHMRKVQTSLNRPTLKDMILSEDHVYLEKFAPFCSIEEFSCFSNLIKSHEIDEEDAELITSLAELNSIRHPSTIDHGMRPNKGVHEVE